MENEGIKQDGNGVKQDGNGVTQDGNGVTQDGNGVTQDGNGVISTRSYLGTLLLGTFPILGDILLLKWSKDTSVRASKQNMCRAYLILKLSVYYPVYILFILIVTGVCNG